MLMSTPTSLPNDEERLAQEEILRLLEGQAVAWNRGDIEGFMAGYWRAPELSLSSGRDAYRGWNSTLDRYRKRYLNDGREMGQLALTNLEIELLSQETAFVRGQWQVTTRQNAMNGLFTLILRKFDDGWRIIHDHTSA